MKLILVAAIAGLGATQKDIIIGGGDHDKFMDSQKEEYSDFTEEEISYSKP